MKKLRATVEEKVKIIEDIQERLAYFNTKSIEDFDIQDIIKENTKIPENVKKPILVIEETAYIKMYELVKQSQTEIQWHMMIRRDLETQIYRIYDILLYPQINTGTSTTTDEIEFMKWQMELIKDTEFPIEELRGHGHSHVNMSVYSSGIDDAYQKDLITKVLDGDFYVFLVLNKRMEMYALIYDFAQQIVFDTDEIDIRIITASGEEIKSWCKEQIEKNCTTETYSKYTPTKTSSLKIDNYIPPEDELIVNIQQKIRNFGKRR